jgi:hypothetical protein
MERNMKLINLLIGILVFGFTCSVSPTTINGRFNVIEVNGTKSVLLQINSNTGVDALGGTTILFSFDTTSISFPNNPVNDIDYTFLNFNEGNYSSATVTRPMTNQIWVNIDLPYTNNNNGTVVVENPEWTDVVTINFSIVDPSHSANLTWLTVSPFWGVYDDDNSTFWQIGEFEDFVTSLEPVSELPTNFELSQNYPNPFNPSTKIKYKIPSTGINNSVLVRLKVYDILGNEVTTLVDEEKEPGIYEVEFSTSNFLSTIASGIYIYKIESADFIDTKKMVLLK